MKTQKQAVENIQNRTEAGQTAGQKRTARLSKTHQDSWVSRLRKRTYTHKGRVYVVPNWQVRFQYQGKEAWFNLDTPNKADAAVKARNIYVFLLANGWNPTLAKFKQDDQRAVKTNITVGDFLGAVRGAAVPTPLKLRTFINYQNCLRTIVAEAFGVRGGNSRYDYRGGGNAEWLRKIDTIRLARLTPDKVNEWKKRRLARAGNSPVALASARRTFNTYVRCARSLFSPTLLKRTRSLELPAVLPFVGVELEETGSMKYVSKINARALIAAARNELKPTEPEAYKVFLLGLLAGMRKAEIDSAEWRMLDFENHVIKLEETEWLHLKTPDSAGEITADAEVFAELKEFMPAASGPFIVSSRIKFRKRARGGKEFEIVRERPPRNDSVRPYYRCAPVFARLNTWLRGKGINANKPLHELRKEVGALVSTDHGIFAAKEFLRHSDITTTARHYAAHKKRISTGLGPLLKTEIRPSEKAA